MFDGFGRFMQRIPGMGGMPQAPQQPEPGVMGFPAMPGPQMGGMAPPRRGGGWRQNLDIIGSGLREMSGETGQLAGAQKRIAGAGQSEREAQFRANLPADQQAVFDVSPELWAQYFGKPKEAARPQRFTTPTGIVEFGEGDEPTMAYPFPEKPVAAAPAPAGYRWGADGVTLEYIPGGPADPRTVGVRASAGRAPPRKPSGGGRGGAAPADSGSGPWTKYRAGGR
jgi:hypothetical protein